MVINTLKNVGEMKIINLNTLNKIRFIGKEINKSTLIKGWEYLKEINNIIMITENKD